MNVTGQTNDDDSQRPLQQERDAALYELEKNTLTRSNIRLKFPYICIMNYLPFLIFF